jgi:NADPH-dependent 2,4-dienoyl-CoA reductase/sulfur reductase-like enzyme
MHPFMLAEGADQLCRRFTIIDEADELLGPDWDSEFSMLMAGGGEYSTSDTRDASYI